MKECESCRAKAVPSLRLREPDFGAGGREATIALGGESVRLEVTEVGYSRSLIFLTRHQATLLHDWIEAVMPALAKPRCWEVEA